MIRGPAPPRRAPVRRDPNREYNSNWGRWLTPDPGGKNVVHLDDPQTWNMYAYTRNNFTTLTDPSGLLTPAGGADPFESTHVYTGTIESFDQGTERPGGEKAQQQNSSQGQPDQPNQPSSWDKTKPLPDDPSKLGPDWKKNPQHKDPNGEEYINDKTGEKVEWNKGRSGQKGWRGKDHWHYTPPGGERGDRHYAPGTTIQKVGFWTTVGAVAAGVGRAIITGGEACVESGLCEGIP